MRYIDMNSDLGESFGPYHMGNDEEVLRHVTSVNIACGFHAGDPQVMKRTVENAIKYGVAIGAHPGFPDLEGFGRRMMHVTFEEAVSYIIYQVSALNGFVKAAGGLMQHVKPHGALYNMAAQDYQLARAIAEGIYTVDKDLILMGLSGSELIQAGKDVGLQTANEVFADRRYTKEGTLVSRSKENAVILDKEAAAEQVLYIVQHGKVKAVDGTDVDIEADSICVHGDNSEAVQLVCFIKDELKNAQITIKSMMNS